jgi:hypothetical protein
MNKIAYGIYDIITTVSGEVASWIESRPCAIGLHRWGRVKPIEGGYYYRECERCFEKKHI